MRERNAMYRVAAREVLPGAVLLLVSACVLALVSWNDWRAVSFSVTLWLLPGTLYCGLAVGRAAPRTFAFLLARPCRRQQLLVARATIALVALGLAWALAIAVTFARSPGWAQLLDAGFYVGLLVLAMVCGALGATATDRESLGFGIATLVFFSVPMVPLLGVEALDITVARVVDAHPIVVTLLVLGAIFGFGRASWRAWRDHLPLRDRWTTRALVTRCAGTWALVEIVGCVLIWSSASASEATPLVVVGASEHGVIVLSGSGPSFDGTTGVRLDGVARGIDEPFVVLDTTQRNTLLTGQSAGDVVHAVVGGGRVAVAVVDRRDPHCRIAVGDGDERALRWLEHELEGTCPRLSLSPSGSSLAALRGGTAVIFDVDDGTPQYFDVDERGILGWSDEQLVWWAPHGRGDDRQVFRGTTPLATVTGTQARLSPDGERLAFGQSIAVNIPGRRPPGSLAGVAVLSLRDGVVRSIHEDAVRLRIVGWIDSDHVAIDDDRGTPAQMTIVHADTGTIVVSVPHGGSYPATHIAGPPGGPWLVTRSGVYLEAWGSDGAVLWHEELSRLEHDNYEARRWAMFDGEVVGIDHHGQAWRHLVPWEVTP
jgi:hypothetical protein